jgi:hypothetical protein
VLRIPANWLSQSLRCKHCGTAVQVKPKAAATVATLPPAPSLPLESQPILAPVPAVAAGGAFSASADLQFPTAEDSPSVRLARRYRRSPMSRWLGVLGVVLCLGVVAGSAYYFREPLNRLLSETEDQPENPTKTKGSAHSAPDVFPRRALIICINNYLYANPVSYSIKMHNIHLLPDRLRHNLHIEPTQLIELSDAAQVHPEEPVTQEDDPPIQKKRRSAKPAKPARPAPVRPTESPARPPLKPVIEQTITEFLGTSRAQDRILLLFIGHVVELEGAAYLVPLEGDFSAKESLIPLTWLYDRLQHCKARQKVLVVDTCREDPGRGQERPGSGPMPAKVAEILAKPPPGVQVWSACSGGEYSYELDGDSIFLEKFYEALTPRTIGKLEQESDPLPLEPMAQAVEKSVVKDVGEQLKAKQTPRLAGQAPEGGAAYDPGEALPPPLAIPRPAPPAGGFAKREMIRGILNEIELPPIKLARSDTAALRIEDLVPFAAKKLDDYEPDASLKDIEANPMKYPVRVAVLEAVKLLREKFNPQQPEVALREYFGGNNSDAIKKEILKEQEKPADVLSELEMIRVRLAKLNDAREEESSKRWQAHYDYVYAQVLARIAYLKEYSLMLGKIRKDELPALEPIHTGYRLASKERLQSGSEVRNLAKDAKNLLKKVARQNKGTPWEILAKRDLLTALGLEWQPTK